MQTILIFVIKFYRFVDINFVGYAKNYKLSVDEIENSKASSSWDLRIINKFWSMQSTNWGNDTCSKFKNARRKKLQNFAGWNWKSEGLFFSRFPKTERRGSKFKNVNR